MNGRPAALGRGCDTETDTVRIDGKPLPQVQKHVYILLNKPRGYVTTLSDEKGREDVTELLKDCDTRVYPVGRLDMDSEGLLLLTNDGAFANGLMHPRGEVEKVYLVWVTGYEPGKEALLGRPITLDGYGSARPRLRYSEPRAPRPGWRSPSTRAGTGRSAGCVSRRGWRSPA